MLQLLQFYIAIVSSSEAIRCLKSKYSKHFVCCSKQCRVSHLMPKMRQGIDASHWFCELKSHITVWTCLDQKERCQQQIMIRFHAWTSYRICVLQYTDNFLSSLQIFEIMSPMILHKLCVKYQFVIFIIYFLLKYINTAVIQTDMNSQIFNLSNGRLIFGLFVTDLSRSMLYELLLLLHGSSYF